MHLLKLEWLKLKNIRIFRSIVILYAIALPGLLLTVKTFKFEIDDMPPFLQSFDILFKFPTVWEWLAYVGNWLSFFFIGFLGVIMVTNEYSYKTLRQNIITGLSRKQYYLSKVNFIFAASAVVTLYYIVWCLIFGFLHTDTIYINTLQKNTSYILRFFIMNLGYMSFGFLLGVLIKRTGIALLLYVTYIMVIESILRGLHLYFFQNESMHFFPMNALEDLAPFPIMEQAENFTEENGFGLLLDANMAMILSVAYIGLYLLLSFQILKKSDL
jgi:ABC-type transport system involved in multi-copper enzyme maturation permease subunit